MDENGQAIVTPEDKPQLDSAALEAKAQAKAEEIANQKVQALKDELAQSLSGKAARQAPKSWEDLESGIETRTTEAAVKAAEERITKKFEERERAAQEKQNLTLKQQEEAQKAEWAQMSKEWAEAVADGVIPDIKPEVKAKLKSNVAFSELTPEEQNDPGLKAYNDGRLLHAKLKGEGKSTSFYRTLQKFYNKMPAGAYAPVIGGSTPTPGQSEELSYDEIAANRRKIFKF